MSFNYWGLWTLTRKEISRFMSVSVQTILAPLVTTLLYLLIFGHVMQADVSSFGALDYGVFMLPGLIMMTLMQNAYSNSSSSLLQSKIHGNFDFILLSPLTPLEITLAFILGSIARGIAVGFAVFAVAWLFFELPLASYFWIIYFAVVSAAFMGALGLITGVLSSKYDHMAAFQNFVIMPLTFLSGVFYSIHQLPEFWQKASLLNPFFYMVDGFRYGFFGVADVSPWWSFAISLVFLVVSMGVSFVLIYKGVKIRR